MTGYLRPTAPIAAEVLLPGDPGLAMAIAQRLMAKPLMANHHHGLWGYSGRTEKGSELTVQSTGIGAPSAAAIVAELREHGARRLIRIGRCAALDPGLAAGDAVVATSAVGADGTTAALGAELAHPDPELATDLSRAAGDRAVRAAVASFDLGASGAAADLRERWAAAGVVVVDLETAALFALGDRLGLALAAVLVVAEPAAGDGDEAAVAAGLLSVAEAAAGAFSRRPEHNPQAAGR